MGKEHQNEWAEAQKIAVSFDLVKAAEKQLLFLAAVDRNRYLYEDHVLQRAIFRYNAYWLPLLAEHSNNPVSEHPLVVPLDCEWIWHCHRLNPIRYKLDCEKLYGGILGCRNVISSIQASSKNSTVEIWNKMYPEEPYLLDINRSFSKDVMQNDPRNEKFTSYDLLAAVKRQIPFTFQISRPHVSDDLFLREAEARYKGFLHLIRANRKRNIQRFCVPTYDVDLMWHTHQLYPNYYCKDLINLLGKVLEHDDTDSDRTKGNKLDTGFSETTKQWEETFGTRYWKAGAMYRGSAPTPVTHVPSRFRVKGKKSNAIENCGNLIQLSERQAVEVCLEFVEIKNLPEDHKNNIIVSFSKKQTDMLFNIKRSLTILSESGEKQVAYFQCEPMGEFLFEIKSESPSNKLIPKSSKVLGSCSLSLQELVSSRSQLSAEKWLSVDPAAGLRISEPILLHVSVSFTPPTPAPQIFYLEQSQDPLRFLKRSCFLPLLKMGKVNRAETQTYVTDDDENIVFSLQMRTIVKDATKCTPDPEFLKEVYCITDSGEKHKVAEFLESNWVIKGMQGSFTLQKNSGNDDHLFELVGNKMVRLFPGRRLDFEPKHCGSQRSEKDFITAVEFSVDYPYGRAIASYDLKLGTIKALDEWIIVPGIILGFILSDILERKGYSGFTAQIGDKVSAVSGLTDGIMQAEVLMDDDSDKVRTCVNEGNTADGACYLTQCGSCEVNKSNGGCGGGCGSGCGGGCGGNNVVSSMMHKSSGGGCGSGCGGGCGENTDKSSGGGCGGGCGSGCGGGCGGDNVVSSVTDKSSGGGCGSGCGSGCGGNNVVSSIMDKSGGAGCGSGCGGGCGGNNVVSSLINEPVAA
ncbi:hypothetical protein vseg_019514 [Gypsophila vaccaria]